ncbi:MULTISPECIES: MFS transporter [Pseudonocardia]|uniref:Inner membrane metabolite transport protein YhjE n=2 Tax=Pseudonocardia TaxID=1847 RepID=A0A1Y2N5L5_PSEAH|nr:MULTISPECIES: MFS transporter [Pseudonocardia]OSY42763.1 Inner membrane metabolite transport protein YhjE [Pseudonocardia autotrophica]TDN77340.1 putative MFS family arabinose efflux permease [Pseudonocardia autotrophica]BBG01362.1 MFS transporter [Pseudonocardia autotrophica]GEC24418.1 MFS transporter [Pseudonocardia saturnea]
MDTSGTPPNPSTLDPDRPADPKATRKAAWAGLVGTTLEQYDFVIYGTASALVFSSLFFPNVSPAAGILASFSAYAVGFLARPLGGLFFSRYGDRFGRKWILVATLLLMGGSTLLIGLLPTYETIGVLAPVLLVLCRFFQGFGAGAEQAGAATLLTETVGRGRRGRYASLVMVGAALGTALGAVVWIAVQQLPEEQLMSWGWRLVFLSSLIVTIVAMVIRRKLDESPVFAELKDNHVAPAKPAGEVFRHGRRPMLLVLFMNVGTSAQSYTFQVFIASYLVMQVGVDSSFVPPVLLIGAICGGIAAFGFGSLSDRVGRRPVYVGIMAGIVLLPWPAFVALNTGDPIAIVVTIVIGFVLAVNGGVGVQMSYFPELFGSRYRYAGVTLGREFSSALGGGVAPLICAALLSAFTGSWIPVAIYMSLIALVSLIAAWMAPETLDRDLTVPHDAGARPRDEVSA